MTGPINDTAGKVWGKTSCIWRGQHAEVHRIQATKGGFCSRHLHAHKHNMFYVERGRLLVEVWKSAEASEPDRTILGPGEMTVVLPNEYHRFTALEDTDAIEIYWVEVDPFDIQRLTHGGSGRQEDPNHA